MKQFRSRSHEILNAKGFTVVELMVVFAIAAIIVVISVPVTYQWVRNAEYRSSARTLYYLLREAKSRSISSNLEHKVEFEDSKKRYRVLQGNRAFASNDWNKIVYDWVELPKGVLAVSNVNAIHLNPTGTSNSGTIAIQDEAFHTKYEVRVANTGRIRIPALF